MPNVKTLAVILALIFLTFSAANAKGGHGHARATHVSHAYGR